MAVTVQELPDSREWLSGGGVRLHYIMIGTPEDCTLGGITGARDAFMAAIPTSYQGWRREPWPALKPRENSIDSVTGMGIWDGTVCYIGQAPVGTTRLRGSTRGGTIHLETGLSRIAAYGTREDLTTAASTADDGGLINVADGQSAGVDIGCGQFDFSAIHVYALASVPSLASLFGLASPNHVNNASVTISDNYTGWTVTFAAGTLLYRGCDFQDTSQANSLAMELSHEFSALPNATGVTRGALTGIAKKGWEYLSTKTQKSTDAYGLSAKIFAAYVDQVYPTGDFPVLGL